MKSVTSGNESGRELKRVIQKYTGNKKGRNVYCICGIHGNEQASIDAVHRVFSQLEKRNKPFAGRFIAIAGNLPALRKNIRFIDEDLNRLWHAHKVDIFRQGFNGHPASVEEREAVALIKQIESDIDHSNGSSIFLDLHTTSAASKPFIIFGDTLRNRRIAAKFKVPCVLGLEEAIPGTLMEYVTDCGHIGISFEAGKHDEPASVDIHEAAIWTLLHVAGCIRRSDFAEEIARSAALLKEPSGNVPALLEVRYRHALENDDDFKMQPGYRNFQPVERGEILAFDKNGSIYAAEMGHILMPLYQGLGNDGFFLTRQISKFWLMLSTILRYLHFSRLLLFLPGVKMHPGRKQTVIVDSRIAKWFVPEIFHLLGFRRITQINKRAFILERRNYDIIGPYHHYSLR